MIREGDIGEKMFPDFPDMKVDFAEIGIGKIGLPPPPRKFTKNHVSYWPPVKGRYLPTRQQSAPVVTNVPVINLNV